MTPQIEERIRRLVESARFGPAQLSLGIKSLIHDIEVEFESQLRLQRAANQDLRGTNVALRAELDQARSKRKAEE
jgi:hypothetical protein